MSDITKATSNRIVAMPVLNKTIPKVKFEKLLASSEFLCTRRTVGLLAETSKKTFARVIENYKGQV